MLSVMTISKTGALFSSLSVFVMSCMAQGGDLDYNGKKFVFTSVPAQYNVAASSAVKAKVNAGIQSATDLTTLLPAGYKKDGSVDYTDYLQRGLDKNRNVVFPDFPVLISSKGLTVSSNSNLYFKPDSKLIMQPNNLDRFEMLRVHGVSNVNIYNANLVGDRKGHLGTTGEHGVGIALRSAKDVNIYSPRISSCWGDGIYIGWRTRDVVDGHYIPSDNINIYNGVIDFNRRNGISIVCGRNINIRNTTIANTYGTLPMSGIDIEPNEPKDIINNITIDSVTTYNNARDGILIVLTRLPKNNGNATTNIVVKNHVDDGSYSAFRLGSGFRKTDREMTGQISVIDPVWKNNEKPFRFRSNYQMLPVTKFKNIKVMGGPAGAGGKAARNAVQSFSAPVQNAGQDAVKKIRAGLSKESKIRIEDK
ncbi:Right handed beta helix region [Chitinophaga eiseniae]|uniref:Right handed beta helix region n=2 Tax=Chitinophaga eiseniae TaxID=634771 RepID=A0A1T4NPJ6_9BACT|nr:Right handed beta helix region [Chitinophaga eiseniae]